MLVLKFSACLGSTNFNYCNVKMEANGKEDLKSPLLENSDSVAINIPELDHQKDEKISTIMFRVRGIECASCATSIESALGNLSGVRSVTVSPLQGQAVVKYIPDLIHVSFELFCLG